MLLSDKSGFFGCRRHCQASMPHVRDDPSYSFLSSPFVDSDYIPRNSIPGTWLEAGYDEDLVLSSGLESDRLPPER